jgi:hypothetical protein
MPAARVREQFAIRAKHTPDFVTLGVVWDRNHREASRCVCGGTGMKPEESTRDREEMLSAIKAVASHGFLRATRLMGGDPRIGHYQPEGWKPYMSRTRSFPSYFLPSFRQVRWASVPVGATVRSRQI